MSNSEAYFKRQTLTVKDNEWLWDGRYVFEKPIKITVVCASFNKPEVVKKISGTKALPIYRPLFVKFTFRSDNAKSMIVYVWLQEKLYFEIDLESDQLTVPQDHLSTESILSRIFITSGKC